MLKHPLENINLTTFGSNLICNDSNHGTNANGIFLITVLVVDEFGAGFPVAWCISNKEDKLHIIDSFMVIKESAGIIAPNVVCQMMLTSILMHGLTFSKML